MEIWRLLLSDPKYTVDWKRRFDYNDGKIEHPCNTDGWQELEESFRDKLDSHELLLPSFFLDEYLQHNTSQTHVNSILMTISNASKEVCIDRIIDFD